MGFVLKNLAEVARIGLTALLSWFVPKEKGLWVFVSFHLQGQYSGNVKALYEYIHEDVQRIGGERNAVYVTNNQDTRRFLEERELPVAFSRVFWLVPLLRAELIFTDGAKPILGLGKFKIIQLWHGTGYKNIGLANNKNTESMIRRFVLTRQFRNTLLIAASSREDSERKQEAFASDKVRVTGSPRNDMFFRNNTPFLVQQPKKILYAPTYRETGRDSMAFQEAEWDLLEELMERLDAVFLVKRHPLDHRLAVPVGRARLVDVTDETDDLQELLATTDLLVTDYSGIASDFVISGRPIIFYTYDFAEYQSASRSFYYDLEALLPGPFASEPSELIALLENLDWFEDIEYQNRYSDFRNRMHDYHDGRSSERFLEEVMRIET